MIGSESLYIEGNVEGALNLPDSRVTVSRDAQVAANITAREVVVFRVGDHKSQSLAGQVGYALEGGFMDTNDIILTIDAEISKLQQVKALLTDTLSLTHAKRKSGRPATKSGMGKAISFNPADFDAKPRKRRGMSAAGRARIAAAQKARWARFKKAAQ